MAVRKPRVKSSSIKSPAGKSLRTKSARKQVARRTRQGREAQPLLINRVTIPERKDKDGFPLLNVREAATGVFYAEIVEGVAIGGKVAWVKGILLGANEAIPATPPRGAAEAIVGQRNDSGTPYRFEFSGHRGGQRNRTSALGPIVDDTPVRLVTWVGFSPPATQARKQPVVTLADRPDLVRARVCNIKSWVVSPKADEVTTKSMTGTVTCEVATVTGAKIARLNGFIYSTEAEAKNALLKGPLTGNTQTLTTPSVKASIAVPQASTGNNNWLVMWAQMEGCVNFTPCDNMPLRLSVS